MQILVVDFGSQYTHLLARRIRSLGVTAEVVSAVALEDALKASGPKGIVLSGGPGSMAFLSGGDETVQAMLQATEVACASTLPVLGVCLGMHALGVVTGGRVASNERREYGHAVVRVSETCPLFTPPSRWRPGGEGIRVWMSHGDDLTPKADEWTINATTERGVAAVVSHRRQPWFGLQFHPEVSHTDEGTSLIRSFVLAVAGSVKDWRMDSFVAREVERIRGQVGETGRVLCALSGGVDSAVTARLLFEAIGDRLTCVLVDHGLLRLGEASSVVEVFRGRFQVPLRVVDAEDQFFDALEGVSDPEQKRKIIGHEFIRCFEAEAKQLGDVGFLGQGTLYPDVVESATGGAAATIKSHHNVGGLPETMAMTLVEPLRDLYKDEVREIGRLLGLPPEMVDRHPFPGPGLAIRIMGPLSRDMRDTLREADAIFVRMLREEGLYDQIWQALCTLLPVRTVGVTGDQRSYGQICALRAVTSVDGMTAECYPFAPEFLHRVATEITNNVPSVGRVVYDITSKPPATIEWE